MRTVKNLFLVFVLFSFYSFITGDSNLNDNSNSVRTQVEFNQNNVSTYIQSSGVFNQNLNAINFPGLEWPNQSGRFAMFTTGLTLAANVNGVLKMAAGSYSGEWQPGYSQNQTFVTNSSFKLYRVKRGDNHNNNPDWTNWGLMVPYGAPYFDVNGNGTYEFAIDTPGVKGADESIFLCMTDADPASHFVGEGFGGGTDPLYAEAHMTAWSYNKPGYEDMQFIKWEVVNKNNSPWTGTRFSIIADPDLGDPVDDYIGCDTTRNLGYCYNSDDFDGSGDPPTYGANPPVIGISLLNCTASTAGMTSFIYFTNSGAGGGPVCETDPTTAAQAYNYMKGVKKDNTPFINPLTNQQTTFCYPGDPAAKQGWTEYSGRIENCNGAVTGNLVVPTPPGDRRFIMNYSPDNFTVNPGDTQRIIIVQYMARGTDFSNSMAKLKQLADDASELCSNGFIVGISQTSTEVPVSFTLDQNYPNPFNPGTLISYKLAVTSDVSLKVYDALGKEVSTLVNQRQSAGSYEAIFDGGHLASGIYFYTLKAGEFTETRRMILMK